MSVAADKADPSRAALYKGMEVRQENEYDRLRMQHQLHKDAMHGELVRVPLSETEPIRVLDSATGDGLWMNDVAKQYPNATFVGTDINAKHFEQLKDLPSSISFRIQSVMDPWPAEDQGAYDLVHQRYCLAMFNPQKEEEIVHKLFELVKPGGRIQLVDANLLGYDGGPEHPGMDQMMAYMERGFREAGMNAAPGPLITDWLQKAGAVDVQDTIFSFPMGRLAATPEAQASTTSNLCAMIDNFAMIGSSK
jgi:ubiquinone/menaquinone biosynthesis C-methylase UbiE